MIFTLFAGIAVAVAIITMLSAINGKHQLYWISAIAFYIFSFLAGFSIGQLTVGLTFIPLALAVGYSFGWIKSKLHKQVFIFMGLLIGCLTVLYVDDAWLFFPFLYFN